MVNIKMHLLSILVIGWAVAHGAADDWSVAFGYHNANGDPVLLEASTPITVVEGTRVAMYGKATPSFPWKYCEFLWDDEAQSCLYILNDPEPPPCSEKIGLDSESGRQQCNFVVESADARQHEGLWSCRLSDKALDKYYKEANKTIRFIRAASVSFDADTITVTDGDTTRVTCSIKTEVFSRSVTAALLLEGGELLAEISDKAQCDEASCVTSVTTKIKGGDDVNGADVVCVATQKDIFGNERTDKKSKRINVIEKRQERREWSVAAILALTFGLLLILTLLLLLILAFCCGWCCFDGRRRRKKAEEKLPTVAYDFYHQQPVQELSAKSLSMPGPFPYPDQMYQGDSWMSDTTLSSSVPPRTYRVNDRPLNVVENEPDRPQRTSSPRQSQPRQHRRPPPPSPVMSAQLPPPLPPRNARSGRPFWDLAAKDELLRFAWEGFGRDGHSDAGSLSSLDTLSHVDELDLEDQFRQLGNPFASLADLFAEDLDSPSESESDIYAVPDLPYESVDDWL